MAANERVARVDRWRVRLDAKDLQRDARGFARIWGTVITADSVLEYGPPDGHPDGHRELVPESTVFDEAALSSLRNAPVTFLHPAEPVTADNSVRLTVGHIVDVKRDGNRLRALHQIEDSQTLAKIADGVVELSPGYTTRLEPGDGLQVDGREVHAIQRERVYNHQAIVPEARAGHDNALTIDARVLPADGLRIQSKGQIMASYAFDGQTVEIGDKLLAHINGLKTDAESGDEKPDGDGKDDADEEDEPDGDGKGDADEDEEEDEKPDGDGSADGDAKPPVDASTDGKKVDAKAIAAAVTKQVLESIKADRKRDAAQTERSRSIRADATAVLPSSYVFEGRTDEQLIQDAIKERDPDAVARAKTLKGDQLHGYFLGVVSAPANRGDSVTVTTPKTSYADAIEFGRKRRDAASVSGVTGDAAMRHESVAGLQFGAKE